MSNDNVFTVPPTTRFQGSSVAISRPKEIACFSYDENHQYFPDDRSLRYYYPPRLGTDLCHGFEQFRQFDDSKDEHLDSLLQTIIEYEKRTGEKVKADVITWRGMMTKIMASPYDEDGFEMNATRFQDTIFIEENHKHKVHNRAEQANQRRPPGMHSQEMMSFWGYKFETLSTIPGPWDTTSREHIENRDQDTVDNHAQYCSIIDTTIGGTQMILAGEVDGVWDAKPRQIGAPINWIELKTSAVVESSRDMQKYERKLLKFWIQSFLLGVPKIIVGMRSKQGVLEHLEELETQKLPAMVKKRGRGTWDGNLCINFTASFLEWLRKVIVGEGVWLIRRPRRSTEIQVLREGEADAGDILTASFRDWRSTFKDGEQS